MSSSNILKLHCYAFRGKRDGKARETRGEKIVTCFAGVQVCRGGVRTVANARGERKENVRPREKVADDK